MGRRAEDGDGKGEGEGKEARTRTGGKYGNSGEHHIKSEDWNSN